MQLVFEKNRLTIVRFAKNEHDDKINFTLLTDCRINNLLTPRGMNFSPR